MKLIKRERGPPPSDKGYTKERHWIQRTSQQRGSEAPHSGPVSAMSDPISHHTATATINHGDLQKSETTAGMQQPAEMTASIESFLGNVYNSSTITQAPANSILTIPMEGVLVYDLPAKTDGSDHDCINHFNIGSSRIPENIDHTGSPVFTFRRYSTDLAAGTAIESPEQLSRHRSNSFPTVDDLDNVIGRSTRSLLPGLSRFRSPTSAATKDARQEREEREAEAIQFYSLDYVFEEDIDPLPIDAIERRLITILDIAKRLCREQPRFKLINHSKIPARFQPIAPSLEWLFGSKILARYNQMSVPYIGHKAAKYITIRGVFHQFETDVTRCPPPRSLEVDLKRLFKADEKGKQRQRFGETSSVDKSCSSAPWAEKNETSPKHMSPTREEEAIVVDVSRSLSEPTTPENKFPPFSFDMRSNSTPVENPLSPRAAAYNLDPFLSRQEDTDKVENTGKRSKRVDSVLGHFRRFSSSAYNKIRRRSSDKKESISDGPLTRYRVGEDGPSDLEAAQKRLEKKRHFEEKALCDTYGEKLVKHAKSQDIPPGLTLADLVRDAAVREEQELGEKYGVEMVANVKERRVRGSLTERFERELARREEHELRKKYGEELVDQVKEDQGKRPLTKRVEDEVARRQKRADSRRTPGAAVFSDEQQDADEIEEIQAQSTSTDSSSERMGNLGQKRQASDPSNEPHCPLPTAAEQEQQASAGRTITEHIAFTAASPSHRKVVPEQKASFSGGTAKHDRRRSSPPSIVPQALRISKTPPTMPGAFPSPKRPSSSVIDRVIGTSSSEARFTPQPYQSTEKPQDRPPIPIRLNYKNKTLHERPSIIRAEESIEWRRSFSVSWPGVVPEPRCNRPHLLLPSFDDEDSMFGTFNMDDDDD